MLGDVRRIVAAGNASRRSRRRRVGIEVAIGWLGGAGKGVARRGWSGSGRGRRRGSVVGRRTLRGGSRRKRGETIRRWRLSGDGLKATLNDVVGSVPLLQAVASRTKTRANASWKPLAGSSRRKWFRRRRAKRTNH
uniref:(northern house mosquito) hypothetical protein n=1 Tax=Culex pipiens TaxID=7175 RepID=A0A8D8HTU5_CULPI